MRKSMLPLFLLLSGTLFAADGDAFRAKLNIEKSSDAVLTDTGMMYLPALQIQSGRGLVFEAEQMAGVDYNFPDVRLHEEADGKSVIHAKFLEYRFQTNVPGKYRAWYYASYPTNLGYQHAELMDDGEAVTIFDSERLAPNVKRWHSGPVYSLTPGEHVWTFPRPNAWNGGTTLDKLMLLPDGMSPKEAKGIQTTVRIAEQGEIFSRRIKASLLKKWQMKYVEELNGGTFLIQYRYDDGSWNPVHPGTWQTVPADARYLYFHFRLGRAATALLSPFIHNLELLVLEK